MQSVSVRQSSHVAAELSRYRAAEHKPVAAHRSWPWRACALAPAMLLCAGIACGADQVSVDAVRQGSAVAVRARATLRAPLDVIWQTLTDYDHLAEFIPGIRKSQVVDRHGNATIVEQAGRAAFLFFTYPIQVVVRSEEHHPWAIRVRVLTGNLKQLDGGYRIERIEGTDDRFVLRWSGIIEPDTPLPLFITVPLVRANLQDQFLAMIVEIERREALRAKTQGG